MRDDDNHSSMKREALFVSDAELIRRLGVGEKTARVAIQELEKHPTFPKKDRLFGKRYWPAVVWFFDRRAGLVGGRGPHVPDGQERPPNDRGARYRRKPRTPPA